MRIYKILPLLVFIAFCCCGCTVELDVVENELPSRTYISDNGYSITVPQNWQENDISESTVEFCAEDNQLSLTITSEFGGVDYYSMREIKDQLTEIIAARVSLSPISISSVATVSFSLIIGSAFISRSLASVFSKFLWRSSFFKSEPVMST